MQNKSSAPFLKSVLKRLGYTFLGLGAALLLLAMSLPSVARTAKGREFVAGIVSASIPGKLELGDIQLSWIGGQAIEGIKLMDADKNAVVTCDRFSTNASLVSLLWNGIKKGKGEIRGLNASFIASSDGSNTLFKALWRPRGHGDPGPEAANHPESLPPIFIRDVNADFTFGSTDEPTELNLRGKSTQGDLDGNFDVHLQVQAADPAKALKNKGQNELQDLYQMGKVHFSGGAGNFPVDLIDQVAAAYDPKLRGLAKAALGRKLDITIEDNAGDRKARFIARASTPTIQVEIAGGIVNNEDGSNHLKLSIEGRTDNNGQPVQLKLQTTIPIDLSNDSFLHAIRKEVQVQAELIGMPLIVADKLLGLDNLLVDAFGSQADLNVSARKQGGYTEILLQIVSEKLSATKIHFRLGEDLALAEPSIEIAYALTPETWNALQGRSSGQVLLAQPATIKMKIGTHARGFPLKKLASIKLAGDLSIDNLRFVDSKGELLGAFPALSVPVELDGPSNRLTFGLSGKIDFGPQNHSGDLQGRIVVENWIRNDRADLKEASFAANFNFSKLPVALLEALTGNADLIALAGKSIDLNLEATLTHKGGRDGALEVALKGDQLEGRASLKVNKDITLNEDKEHAFLQWTMTPERFQEMRKTFKGHSGNDNLVLLEPALVHLSLRSLKIPLSQLKETSLADAIGVNATAIIDRLHLRDNATGQNLVFDNLAANTDTAALSGATTFSLNAKHKDQNNASHNLALSGKLENLVNSNGDVNFHGMSADLQAIASQLPAGVLCELAGIDPGLRQKITAILGHTMDANVKIHLQHMNGPVQAFIQGSNGYVMLDGSLANGFFTLRAPFEAVVNVTPEFGQHILQNVIPILGGTVGAENPLKITIAPDGFAFPIRQFDLRNIRLGQATIELGKMYFKNEGQLAKILSIFTSSRNEHILVWFTPVYLQMQEGVIQVERMDMLINNVYPIALWGSVDLPQDWLNMMVGLSGQALRQAFNVPALDSKYMMALAYKGKIGEASIDKTKVTTRIAALIAQLSGTPQGFVLGTVLQFASNINEDPVPPPTTNPLPWDAGRYTPVSYTADQAAAEEPPQPSQTQTNPIKQLQRGASSLLNNFNPFR